MTEHYQFHLPDMSCGHCVAAITEAVQAADAAATLQFDREQRRVQIASGALDQQALAELLSEAGYPPASPASAA
ncbi:heavy-metal-associated domain-containing protein [Roseateles violae]|uniref:Heavy-metal-associated domain-containing protein n=1 Tax=Roseateles violae TaxID=3058042 RepID=A0ABT8DY10_9BURK|nr:heavy-metal-associated domain-containing protein [Pelomonas sp. PFR6]MDN3922605.1 heavy-metal-associated domain-containing protein [Pelomonas sp. PFR6]